MDKSLARRLVKQSDASFASAEDHLSVFSAGERRIILDAIEKQLSHTPAVQTRNRKPMRMNPLAPWELRVGRFRVYYELQWQPSKIVNIRAVGAKVRNRVWIGNEEIKL